MSATTDVSSQCAFAGRPADVAESPARYRPDVWQIAFVQDCNLYCAYCSTAFGRCGGGARVMEPDVWLLLTEIMLRMSNGVPRIRIEFGTGETFLHFEPAMRFLDHVRTLAAAKGIEVEALIVTNGTVCTADQLRTCLQKKISLCFSIDGPAAEHDFFRKFPDGGSSHGVTLKNWRRYREMVAGARDGTRCTVTSVVAGCARLMDVARFWREQGVERFRVAPVEPSRHLGSLASRASDVWRAQYLTDLETLAFAEAKRLRGSDPEREFRGPLDILDAWRQLNAPSSYRPCNAGHSTIAAGADGILYPCQGFVGFPELGIGDVSSGVRRDKIEAFRLERMRLGRACNGCWARFLCGGGCSAGDPKSGMVLDKPGGCEFSRAHAEIAIGSFQCWRDGAVPGGGAGK